MSILQSWHSLLLQSSATVFRPIGDLLLPPQCPSCRAAVLEAGNLCAVCWKQLTHIDQPLCDVMGTPMPFDAGVDMLSPEAIDHPPAWDRLRAAVVFDDVARQLVYALKYRDRHEATGCMARLMMRAGREFSQAADLVIPVPLHWRRLWQRRFNQSALLARSIAHGWDRPLTPELLVRERATRAQVGLRSAERRKNVNDAFSVPALQAQRLVGQRVVLVDDVKTSGATLDACARTLKKAGAAKVDVLVFALVYDRL